MNASCTYVVCRSSVLVACIVVAATAHSAPAGPPVLIDLGLGATGAPPSISANGSTVVGSTEGRRAFRWRMSTGAIDLGDVAIDASYYFPIGTQVSADGSVISGGFFDPSSGPGVFRWTEDGGMQDIGLPPGGTGAFAGPISADGSTIVPFVFTDSQAGSMRWTVDAGYVTGEPLVGEEQFLVMNGDATVFAQGRSSAAFLWTESGGYENIGGLPGFTSGTSPYAMTDDASVVVGECYGSGDNKGTAWRWTRETGMQDLGLPGPDYRTSMAWDVSADGERVVGAADAYIEDIDPAATLWTPELGMVDLNDYLPTIGVDLSGWNLTFATGISGDGTVICGIGTHDGADAAWVISGIPGPGVPVVLCMAGLVGGRRRRSEGRTDQSR